VAALETADADITVNAVCPGWVATPLVERQIEARAQAAGVSTEEAAARLLGGKQPKRRFVRAEDVAAFVVFLCGPAGATMTGEVLSLDGGWTAQ
jgi:3-hydroxybutyrate dehydrogenase